jgi:hypothetical protein
MLKAGVPVAVIDGGLPNRAGVAKTARLDAESEVDEVRRLRCAGFFDAEPLVAGCGAGVRVLTREKSPEIGCCRYSLCEGRGQKQ